MRNVIIISGAALVWGNSATVARMNNYARALVAGGEVRVYLFSQQFYNKNSELIEVEKNIFTTPKPEKNNVRSFVNGWKFVNRVKKFVHSLEGESVYLFYPEPNPTIEFAFLLRNKILDSSKAFCEVNEVRKYASHLSEVQLRRKIIERSVFWFSEQFIRLYDGVVCISKNIEKYFAGKNKNAIVIPILSNINNEILHSNKLPHEIIRFIFTGSISVEKENLLELLRGFAMFDKKNKEWEFLLYGNCNDYNYRLIKKNTADLGIENKVRLMGEVQQGEIPKILAQGDCLILPRRNSEQNYYGFSTKLSEYAVSGCPIILTNTGVVTDFFTDGKSCLMVDGFDAEIFFAKFVEFSVMTSHQKEAMGECALEVAKNKFEWSNYTTNLLNFIK